MSSILKGKNLLHMGCRDCGREDSYLGVKILNKLGVDVDVKDFQCGCEFFGTDRAKIDDLVDRDAELLRGYNTVIVGCARCYHVLSEYHGVNTRHITQVIYERVKASKREFIGSGEVFYHDPCFLSRYEKVMEEPRRILEMMGYTVREFKSNREESDCCGGYSPIRALRQRGAEMRLSRLPRDSTVTAACPNCTQNFSTFNKDNSKITVRNFLELVDHALDIEIPAVY